MKSPTTIRDKLCKKHSQEYISLGEAIVEAAQYDFDAGFNSATDLVFERIIEALTSNEMNKKYGLGHYGNAYAKYLKENKERILK